MSGKIRSCFFLMLLLSSAAFAADQAQPKKTAVLVVYSSGTPVAGLYDSTMSSETLEAVSAATPVAHNTAQAARIIGAALEAEGLQVRLARVEEFEKKDWREVEAYDYFVLGSPAHFGQMSWEMKKFFDEAFHMIYMSPGKAEGKLFALFSVGAGMPGAKSTVDSMEQAIDMNAGKVVLRLGLDKSMSADEFAAQAADFARSFAVLVGH